MNDLELPQVSMCLQAQLSCFFGRLQPDSALVLREGRWQQLNAEDLVPGDLVQVGRLLPS